MEAHSELLRQSLKSTLYKNIDLRGVRHFEPSIIAAPSQPEPSLDFVNFVLAAVLSAKKNEIVVERANLADSKFYNIFPGEHYRLLKALVSLSRARTVVEIGTYTGMGTISLMQGFDGKESGYEVVTYDIVPFTSFPTHLPDELILKGIIQQRIADLSIPEDFLSNFDILNNADIIFIDGPKDGRFEYALAKNLKKLSQKRFRIIVCDDIRFLNMFHFWNSVKSEKIDLTSFGHWSGTGIINAAQGFSFEET